MTREDFIEICNKKIKLVRTEYDISQQRMAHILGLSKKTLVEIEKARSSLGWSGCVVLCTLFSNSEVIAGEFGGNPLDIIMALAFEGSEPIYPKTLGGKVWWTDVEFSGMFKIQQNILSRHYRILDSSNRRIYSSFDLNEVRKKYLEVQKNENYR